MGDRVADALERLDRSWRAWRGHPDGRHYGALAEALCRFVDAVVQRARGNGRRAVFTAPFRGEGNRVRVHVDFEPGGSACLGDDSALIDLDDVVQDFVLRTLERFCDNPDFRITGPAYIEIGLALGARSALRAARRRAATERTTTVQEADTPDASFTGHDPILLGRSWFHYRGGPGPLPSRLKGLSLRYLYASIRHASGATGKQVAEELGIHGAAVSRTKSELVDLHPEAPSGAFLPLEPMLPVAVSASALDALGLRNDPLGTDRDPLTAGSLHRLQARKRTLWRTWLWAREAGNGLVHGPALLQSDEDGREEALLHFDLEPDTCNIAILASIRYFSPRAI